MIINMRGYRYMIQQIGLGSDKTQIDNESLDTIDKIKKVLEAEELPLDFSDSLF